MNWMIIVPITGGAIASYFAYPYGSLAACLAYFAVGGVLAALELLRQLLLLKSKNDDLRKLFKDEEDDASSRPFPEDSPLSSRDSPSEADSTSPDRTVAVSVLEKD